MIDSQTDRNREKKRERERGCGGERRTVRDRHDRDLGKKK